MCIIGVKGWLSPSCQGRNTAITTKPGLLYYRFVSKELPATISFISLLLLNSLTLEGPTVYACAVLQAGKLKLGSCF